jgi:hypothetical protein
MTLREIERKMKSMADDSSRDGRSCLKNHSEFQFLRRANWVKIAQIWFLRPINQKVGNNDVICPSAYVAPSEEIVLPKFSSVPLLPINILPVDRTTRQLEVQLLYSTLLNFCAFVQSVKLHT